MITLDQKITVNGKYMTIRHLAETIRTNVENDTSTIGCYIYRLGNIGDHCFAIVTGWAPGYEHDENDPFEHEGWHKAIKLGCQPYNSIMQCDFDVDWEMPYDPDTGDVDDTCTTLNKNDTQLWYEDTVKWLVERFMIYKENPENDELIEKIRKNWNTNREKKSI